MQPVDLLSLHLWLGLFQRQKMNMTGKLTEGKLPELRNCSFVCTVQELNLIQNHCAEF